MLDSLFNNVACLQACNFIKKKPEHWYFPVKFGKFLPTSILKNICQRLLLFVSPQDTITNSSGEFGLDETPTEYKVSVFFKRNNFIQSNAAISLCKLKNVSLTFQLTFLLNFWLSAIFKSYFTPGELSRYDVG